MYCRNCGYDENVEDTGRCPKCYSTNYEILPEVNRLESVKCNMYNKVRKKIDIDKARKTALAVLVLLFFGIVAGCFVAAMNFPVIKHQVPGYDFTVKSTILWEEDESPGDYSMILDDETNGLSFYVIGWDEEELGDDVNFVDIQNVEIDMVKEGADEFEIFKPNQVILDTENKKICSAGFSFKPLITVRTFGKEAVCYSYAIDLPKSGEKVWVAVEGASLLSLMENQDEIEAMVMSIE